MFFLSDFQHRAEFARRLPGLRPKSPLKKLLFGKTKLGLARRVAGVVGLATVGTRGVRKVMNGRKVSQMPKPPISQLPKSSINLSKT